MKTRCATRFRDPNNAIVAAGEWENYLNDAKAEVDAASERWPWLESRDTTLNLAAGVSTVAIPGSGWFVLSVLDSTNDAILDEISMWTTPDRVFPSEGDETGPPEFYRVFGSNIEVYPTPDDAVVLHVTYLTAATELSAGGDVPPWGSEFHRILVEGALSKAFLDDGNLEQGQAHAAVFQGLLAQMKATYLRNRGGGFAVLGDNWSGM